MSFQQLYYTSCERGLSGYAGYQFNAVTEGTSAETMRQVESLTAYEPPQSSAYPAGPEDLALCPVNLCFAPGKTTIVANVQYTGRDSSRRFGNYFAHALATPSFEQDNAGLLPIELWRAPLWHSQEVEDPGLPAVEGPLPAGPVDGERVGRFLDEHARRDQLPALLSAVGLAQSRLDRSVLVVEDATDDVAMWFAAVSYMLPPRFIQRLSFATYLNRPSRSRLHLLGTVSETNLDLGSDAPEQFYLFDFPGERFTAVPELPLASLCVGIGLRELPALWDWANSLATGEERTFEEWYPIVAAAAALGRVQLTEADLDAVAGWLQDAARLPAGTQGAIGWALHGHPAITAGHRLVLRDVGQRTGDTQLREQAQYELIEPQMLAAMTGAVPVGPVEAAAVAGVEDRLTAKCEELLRLCDSAADALRLLSWAARARLRLDAGILVDRASTVIAPMLTKDAAGRPIGQEQREQARDVAGRWPPVREGLVIYLTGLAAASPAEVAAAMSGVTGELLTEQDVGQDPSLRLPYLIYQALRQRKRSVEILAALADRREVTDADQALLGMLWPGGSWSLAEAAEVLAAVNPGVLRGALGWFDQTLARLPERGASKDYAELCQQLVTSPLASQFGGHQALEETAGLDRALTRAADLGDLSETVRSLRTRTTAPAQVLTRRWLVSRLMSLPGRPDQLAGILRQLEPGAVSRYLGLLSDLFAGSDARAPGHAAALWLYVGSDEGRKFEPEIGHLLRYAAMRWRADRKEKAIGLVASVNTAQAGAFAQWMGLADTRRIRKLIKKTAAWPRALLSPATPVLGSEQAVRPAAGEDGPAAQKPRG